MALDAAQKRKKAPVRVKGQLSRTDFARVKTEEVNPYETLIKANMGTTNFTSYDVGKGGTYTGLDDFMEWLKGVEENRRSEREALQITYFMSRRETFGLQNRPGNSQTVPVPPSRDSLRPCPSVSLHVHRRLRHLRPSPSLRICRVPHLTVDVPKTRC